MTDRSEMHEFNNNDCIVKSHIQHSIEMAETGPEAQLLTPSDRDILGRFIEASIIRAKNYGVLDINWRIQIVAAEAKIHFSSVSKNLHVILWVAFLRIMREYIPAESYKYKNVDQFLAAYSDRDFSKYSEHEQLNLMSTANWMTM